VSYACSNSAASGGSRIWVHTEEVASLPKDKRLVPERPSVWVIHWRRQNSCHIFKTAKFNPLDSKGNYSATSNNTKLVHWPLMDGLLHLVQWWGACAGWGPAQSPPRCTKYNSPPINGQCTNDGPLLCGFNVAIKGLKWTVQLQVDLVYCCKFIGKLYTFGKPNQPQGNLFSREESWLALACLEIHQCLQQLLSLHGMFTSFTCW